MGRRKLLPNINNLLLQLHLPHRNNGSQANESNHETEDSSSKETTHNQHSNNNNTSTAHHHHLHIFTWPSLKRRPSSSSLASSSSTEDDHDHDTDNETDALKHNNTIYNNHTSDSLYSNNSHKSVVSFGHCEVRSYTQVLGDHPCCSEGCPIQLGWSYTCEESMKVDDYERFYHTTQRAEGEIAGPALVPKYTVLQDLRLSPEERRSILILSKQQEYVNATVTANANDTDSENDSACNNENDPSTSAFSEGEDGACTQAVSSPSDQFQCERELSRECRRLNRCGGWNVNVKASRKRNKRNQEAFFGSPTKPAQSTIERIPPKSIAAPTVL